MHVCNKPLQYHLNDKKTILVANTVVLEGSPNPNLFITLNVAETLKTAKLATMLLTPFPKEQTCQSL